MALVAYENSDSSDYEDEGNENASVVKMNEKDSTEILTLAARTAVTLDSEENLFNLLPQPSKKIPEIVEEDDEFLHKKAVPAGTVKPKARITVPSLSDFKDIQGTAVNVKPRIATGKKSGLLSMLPQPKNSLIKTTTRSLIPHVLTQKPSTSNVKKKAPLPSPLKKRKEDKTLPLDDSDDSGDEEVQNDFFSINKPVELPIVEDLPLKPKQQEPVQNVASKMEKRDLQSYFKQDRVEEPLTMESDYLEPNASNMDGYVDTSSYCNNGYAQDNAQGNGALDDEAILKLCGTRGKRKREEIQIVDVNQDEVLADARKWLMKGLMDDTTKRVSSSKKKGNEPTHQQKRKHQITYLAHQAKANEAELQNQWANNRMSKRQTQSKYGF